MDMVMKILGWLWAVTIVWCVWDFYKAPIMPDDYNEDGVNPDHTEIDDDSN